MGNPHPWYTLIMSYILKNVRPDNLQNWVKTNAVGSLKATPRESWRAYLAANGGTGQSISSLEMTFLAAQGAAGATLADKWTSYLSGSSGSKGCEKVRSNYK